MSGGGGVSQHRGAPTWLRSVSVCRRTAGRRPDRAQGRELRRTDQMERRPWTMGGRSPTGFAASGVRRYRGQSGFLGGRADTAHRGACAGHAGAVRSDANPRRSSGPSDGVGSTSDLSCTTSPSGEQSRRAANPGAALGGTCAASEAIPRLWSLAGSVVGTSSHSTRPDLRQRKGLLDLGRDRPGRRAAGNPKRGRRQRLFTRPVRGWCGRVWSGIGLRRLPHHDGWPAAGPWARGGRSCFVFRPLLPAGGPGRRRGKFRSVLRCRQNGRARHALVVDSEAQ